MPPAGWCWEVALQTPRAQEGLSPILTAQSLQVSGAGRYPLQTCSSCSADPHGSRSNKPLLSRQHDRGDCKEPGTEEPAIRVLGR